MKLNTLTTKIGILAAVGTLTIGAAALADAPANAPGHSIRPVIVLVHGAFADGTSWRHVIPLLEEDGYTVIAVQNPLSSLDADVATTRRVIDAQTGPVVVVGHSYGGAVVTGAAAGEPGVKALVYISAFAPDAGEPVGAFLGKYPTPLGGALVPDAAGFLFIDRAKFHAIFCADVPGGEARIMAAVQKPLAGSAFGASVPVAAWKTIPAWYIVGQEDRAISPDLERFYAKRMGAHTTEISSSHVSFVSHPREVVRVIEEAATAPTK